jgi:glycosyltransferase involved in cell wall biosynthesis/Flp pilus assembly protein TadD
MSVESCQADLKAIAARTALEHGDVENALATARAALAENSSCRDALLVFAELAILGKNFALAQKLAADLARKNPSDGRTKQLAKRLSALSGKTPAPKHILLYTDDPGLGGVAQYNHALLLALVEQGYLVTCVQTESDTPLVREQRERGIRHRWLDYDTGREFARTQTDNVRAKRIFEGDRPDLIVFSDCCPFSNMAARDAAMHLGIPYMVVVGFVGAYLARDFPGVLEMLLPQHAWAKAVVAVSQENLQLLHERFGTLAGNSEVIHYGRPAKFFASTNAGVRHRLRAELGVPADAVICFTAARLTAIKGFGVQLQAMKALCSRKLANKLILVWAGEGDEKGRLAQEIENQGLADRIRLLGHRWDVADWYDAADIFCLPSFVEGMPLAIMEAMAKGLPVVASAVSGIPEELGDTGQLLPDPHVDLPAAVQTLAETLHAWTEDPGLRRKQGARCRDRAVKMFREEIMTGATLHLIKRVLMAAPAAAAQLHGADWASAPSPQAQAAQSKFWLRAGNQTKALRCASAALADDPTLVDALVVLAELALAHEGGAQAETMFRRARQISVNDATTEGGLAQALIVQSRLDEARDVLHAALRHAPKDARLLSIQAQLQEAEARLVVVASA